MPRLHEKLTSVLFTHVIFSFQRDKSIFYAFFEIHAT